ncbi:sigma factor [Anaerocolumna sp.]|uniref:sigma factor n=1 Tax=Anaerocolumna sp. TaxID=2041569 RepID=UPI0028ACBE19|nr:sigma factor [Anaerocolumna sp.]
MSDANKFHEMLSDIMEVARVQGNQLTMEDVKSLFGDMNLTDGQYDHIYAYLAANKIKIKGYVDSASLYTEAVNQEKLKEEHLDKEDSEQKASAHVQDKDTLQEEDSVYLKMYLEDLEGIKDCTLEEELTLINHIITGDFSAKQRYIEGNLRNVIKIAKEYRNKGVTLEDLIQEGNIALMNALEHLQEFEKETIREQIIQYIRNFIEAVINEEKESSSFGNSIVDRTDFLNNAAKELAEDLGRNADIHELAVYTKLSEREIKDILSMSGDAVKVSVHHHRKDGKSEGI